MSMESLQSFIKELTFPSLIFQSEPHFGHRDVWVAGRISKGSGFCIYVLLLFCASPFCDVQWLVRFPFYKGVILNNLLFQNFDPLLQPNFLSVLPSS